MPAQNNLKNSTVKPSKPRLFIVIYIFLMQDPIQNIKFRPQILLNLYLTIYFHFRPETSLSKFTSLYIFFIKTSLAIQYIRCFIKFFSIFVNQFINYFTSIVSFFYIKKYPKSSHLLFDNNIIPSIIYFCVSYNIGLFVSKLSTILSDIFITFPLLHIKFF